MAIKPSIINTITMTNPRRVRFLIYTSTHLEILIQYNHCGLQCHPDPLGGLP